MNMIDCKQIISSFVERYGFSAVYANNTAFDIPSNVVLPSKQMAVEYMIGASLAGRKSIGFFSELPHIQNNYMLRTECIFITNELPKSVMLPTIFCKKPADLYTKLLIGGKVSQTVGVPVIIVISDNVINNICEDIDTPIDIGRTNSYISNALLESTFTNETYTKALNTAHEIIKEELKNDISGDKLSFYDVEADFFDYLLPVIDMPELKKAISSSCCTTINEKDIVFNYLSNHIKGLKLDTYEPEPVIEINDILCSDSVFVLINSIIKKNNSNIIVFSDIECPAANKYFDVKKVSLEMYAGIASSGLNVDTLFIANASTYNKTLVSNISNGHIILINDINVSSIRGFSKVRNPKRLTTNKNILLSCTSGAIKKYNLLNNSANIAGNIVHNVNDAMQTGDSE